jgi:hypothetical protein
MIKLLLLFYFIQVLLICDHLWNDFFVGFLFPRLFFLTLLTEKIVLLFNIKSRININSNTNILIINLLKKI